MLNKIWSLIIIISILFSIFSGNIENLNNEIFVSAENAVKLCINLLGTLCLWNGIINIAIKSKKIDKINIILNPVINKLFPEIKNNNKIKKEISMNILANILGLGNAATPLGIKAMKSLQEENKNKNKLSNSMMMFIVINTASLQIIPTTIIAIRNSFNSNNPTNIIVPVWCSSICALLTAIIITKLLIRRKN